MVFIIDLFSGVGGYSRGFYEAGYEILLAIDKDLDASISYKSNFPKTDVWVIDIRKVDSIDIINEYGGDIDVIIASPPCEAFTQVSRDIMKDPVDRLYTDPRGRLTLEAIRIIGDIKPRVFVIENVPGITVDPIPDLIRYEFKRVGYDRIYFNKLNAIHFGVPSYRRRVFISNIKIKPRIIRTVTTVWDAIKDLPDPRYPNEIPNHAYIKPPKRFWNKMGRITWNKALDYFRGGDLREYKQYMRLHPFKPAPTIMGKSRFIHPYDDRILTVREEARIMGYPDNHIFSGGTDQQFNQVGESVPPPLAKAIAEYIYEKLFG